MKTQRFNPDHKWTSSKNYQLLGLCNLIEVLSLSFKDNTTMIEIGSYMGESTMLFASSKMFSKIYTIEPHSGTEIHIDENDYDWDIIKQEYKINTRHFDNITHIEDYSYNVVNQFKDESIDFIYIDANHSYESVKKDLELYLPKLKQNGWIGGHDYNKKYWPGVIQAVNENLGIPEHTFKDFSWLSKNKRTKLI